MAVANTNSPFLKRLALALFCILSIGFLIFIGQDIIIPVAFSILLGVLLLPINNLMERKGFTRVAAIMISLFIALLFIAGLIYFLSSQIANFVDDLPTIKKQLDQHVRTLQRWVSQTFSISRSEQKEVLDDAAQQLKGESGSSLLGQTFLSITSYLVILILLPIYTFLILYYRDMIKRFLINVFTITHKEKVMEVLKESRIIVQSYMMGLLIEMGIVATINISGFLILGIKYAFFLGLLAALLNLIPYIGMLIASVFCMMVTLTTSTDITQVLYVLLVLVVVQFIDNNLIMPKIVGSKVKINALMTILGVLIGGSIAGVSGMFLSIPVVAIMKVIFDRVEGLEPWGELLGDDITGQKRSRLYRRLAKLRAQKKKEELAEKNE
ncbi:MAG: AI-2E family transporter [Chitinophagaceae bacterium]